MRLLTQKIISFLTPGKVEGPIGRFDHTHSISKALWLAFCKNSSSISLISFNFTFFRENFRSVMFCFHGRTQNQFWLSRNLFVYNGEVTRRLFSRNFWKLTENLISLIKQSNSYVTNPCINKWSRISVNCDCESSVKVRKSYKFWVKSLKNQRVYFGAKVQLT